MSEPIEPTSPETLDADLTAIASWHNGRQRRKVLEVRTAIRQLTGFTPTEPEETTDAVDGKIDGEQEQPDAAQTPGYEAAPPVGETS